MQSKIGFHTTVGVVLLAIVVGLLGACFGSVRDHYPPAEGPPAETVFVVRHSWHTGIAMRNDRIPDGVWPEHRDLGLVAYLEVGWGDRAYYQTPDAGWGLALRAILWPTPSVLHVAGFDRPVEAFFPGQEIVAVRVSRQGFENLCRYIHDAYARTETGEVVPLGPGLYGQSRFYRGQESYFLFRNCNLWTARALRAAGCPISASGVVRVEDVMKQVREFGKVVQEGASDR